MKLSIVSPVYKAEEIVDELVQRITEFVSEITDDFEIILVEDGSQDGSWQRICEISKNDKRIKGVKFTRNFGQHFAITAGLKYSKGDYVVILDCDLQNDPEDIPALYEKAKEGYEIVYARRRLRNYGFFKNLAANIFYMFLSLISDFKMDTTIGSFSILSRKVVNSFLKFGDYKRCYVMVLKWLGFKWAYVEVDHKQRYAGESAYSLQSLIKLAETHAVFYSDRLLKISIYVGTVFSTVAFLGVLYLLYRYFFIGVKEGWTSVMVLISLVGGLTMISLGILGLYIGQIFEQVKNRPMFIVQESINCELEDEFLQYKESCLLEK